MKSVTRLIGIHASPDVDNCVAIKIDVEFEKAYVSSAKFWSGKGGITFMAYDLANDKDAFQIDHYIIDRNDKWEQLHLAFKNHGLDTNSILISKDRRAFDGLTDFVTSIHSSNKLYYPNQTKEITELQRQIKQFSSIVEKDGRLLYCLSDETHGDIVWAFLAGIFGVQKTMTDNTADLI